MPTYIYECKKCELEEIERMVRIEDRDGQYCGNGHKLERKVVFTPSVYAPTSGGMR